MVFDVPAESGGAMTILNQYYDAAIKDHCNEWIFVISTPMLNESEKVKVVNYPWVKKSWFHRLYFDKFVAPRLVERHKVDEVLSLQNIVIPNIKVKQILYLHQPLPFVERRYAMTENFKFWIYQNIIGYMIIKSIRKADNVIVQTKWMLNAALDKAQVRKEKFILKQPKLNIDVKKLYKSDNNDKVIFFYPSSGVEYKNHTVIVEAIRALASDAIDNYRVVFTLKGNENRSIKKLKAIANNENLPIEFIGAIDINSVYDYYSKSRLIFPSTIETFGLPLLEAKMHGCPILASDCAFSHEILDGYDKVDYFNPFDSIQLANLIKLTLVNR